MSTRKYNPTNIESIVTLYNDLESPGAAIEVENIASGAVTTFTHILTGGIPYIGFSRDATVYYTINGQTPSLAAGVGADKGIPLPVGIEKPLYVAKGDNGTLKVTGPTASAVFLYRACLSSSL